MIVIIDSGIGNIRSVANALEYLKAKHTITSNPKDLKEADKIIFPGVGSFADGMKAIHSTGLIDILKDEVLKNGKPYLGICLGMQLLAESGEEDGKHTGLGWIPGVVRQIDVKNTDVKLPHIGWNTVQPKPKSVLFKDLGENPTFYFVHSYIFTPKDSSIIESTCEYREVFAASIRYKNIFGVQFHPEKSQMNGLNLIKNFVTISQLPN